MAQVLNISSLDKHQILDTTRFELLACLRAHDGRAVFLKQTVKVAAKFRDLFPSMTALPLIAETRISGKHG